VVPPFFFGAQRRREKQEIAASAGCESVWPIRRFSAVFRGIGRPFQGILGPVTQHISADLSLVSRHLGGKARNSGIFGHCDD
jgi:hypothetical protein